MPDPGRDREGRLDRLREEAARTGRVTGTGVTVDGGPIPPPAVAEAVDGYYGRPVVKPPVWTWEVPLYFFVGGVAGTAGIIAFAALALGKSVLLARAALWLAAAGALVSPLLLILDLGRPKRFLAMLRVFKWRSPMSVGVWTLILFGAVSLPAALVIGWFHRLLEIGIPQRLLGPLLSVLTLASAVTGALLATYVGVLLAVTAVPAWFKHRALLPLHFGLAGLGSAAASLELLGFRLPALHLIGLAVAGLETGVGIWLELRRHGAADRALRRGRAGLLLRTAGALAGPGALLLRLAGWIPAAAVSFLVGALVSRYGWLAAGEASARDPRAVFAAQ